MDSIVVERKLIHARGLKGHNQDLLVFLEGINLENKSMNSSKMALKCRGLSRTVEASLPCKAE